MLGLAESTLAPAVLANPAPPSAPIPEYLNGEINGKKFSDLIPLSKVCNLLGLSANTVRNYDRLGILPAYRIGTAGHRRWSRNEVTNYLNGLDGTNHGNRSVVCYCRCSTVKQKDNLQRQIDRVMQYAHSNYEGHIDLISDLASSANLLRPGFARLIKRIIDHEVATVICEYRDRLNRGFLPAIELIAQHCGTELVFIDQENKTDEQILVEDLTSYIFLFGIKNTSRRIAEKKRKKLSPTAVERGRELIDLGLTGQRILQLLEEEGFSCTDGSPINIASFRKLILLPYKGLIRSQPIPKASNAYIYRTECIEACPNARILLSVVYDDYKSWCGANNQTEIGKVKFYAAFNDCRTVKLNKSAHNQEVEGKAWKEIRIRGKEKHLILRQYNRTIKTYSSTAHLLEFLGMMDGSAAVDNIYKNYVIHCQASNLAPLKKAKVEQIIKLLNDDAKH